MLLTNSIDCSIRLLIRWLTFTCNFFAAWDGSPGWNAKLDGFGLDKDTHYRHTDRLAYLLISQHSTKKRLLRGLQRQLITTKKGYGFRATNRNYNRYRLPLRTPGKSVFVVNHESIQPLVSVKSHIIFPLKQYCLVWIAISSASVKQKRFISKKNWGSKTLLLKKKKRTYLQLNFLNKKYYHWIDSLYGRCQMSMLVKYADLYSYFIINELIIIC